MLRYLHHDGVHWWESARASAVKCPQCGKSSRSSLALDGFSYANDQAAQIMDCYTEAKRKVKKPKAKGG